MDKVDKTDKMDKADKADKMDKVDKVESQIPPFKGAGGCSDKLVIARSAATKQYECDG
ncbi:hypothetical protein LJC30_05460 [Odoribacter sp. OttesenSCG-928-L07]|nr:hypothetical protein [Odoribacter sp. OttesenSCG-928-L07]MDL2239619.1 hypothetical protein [Bacteroidales bacterium OttesenSCG-928-L14]